MKLYDYLSIPEEYAIEKPIDKKEFLNPAFSDQQNEVLLASVNQAVLKYRICTPIAFDVVEVSVNEYQYFYFLPLSIFQTVKNPTLLVMEYNGKYKLCINIAESENKNIKPYFTGWIDTANPQGRMISLLEKMNFEKLDLTNAEGLLQICRETVVENKAVYVTGNKIEFMVKFFVGFMKRGAITKIKNMVKNKCTAFAYQQKKGYRKGFNNYYRGYIFLYDLDELWSVLMEEEWIGDKLQKWSIHDGLGMLNRYENYHQEHKYIVDLSTETDNSDFAFSDVLYESSNWQGLDFVRKEAGKQT